MANTCAHSSCGYPVFSKKLCKSHWQKEYGKPLKKSVTPLKRTPLKRSTKPIPKVSEKRKVQLEQYYPERDKFLKERPLCELKVDSGCTIKATEVHHTYTRAGEMLLDVKFWKAGCRHCHDHATEHSKEAIENGQSISRHKKTNHGTAGA